LSRRGARGGFFYSEYGSARIWPQFRALFAASAIKIMAQPIWASAGKGGR
jgi:hypothetical protein